MPHYYFDIKDGHRFVDASGLDLRNDDAAIAKAKVLAIGVSIDKPEVDPKRHIAVLNGSPEQIFSVPLLFQTNNEHHVGIRRINRPSSARQPQVGDERNGTERIRGEPQSDGRALHPPASETRPISGTAARLPMCYSEDHAPPIREESSASVCSFNSTPITLETTRRQSGGSHRGGRPRRPARR